MKLSLNAILAAILVAVTALNKTSAAEADLLEPLRSSVRQAISEFDRIDESRKKTLKEAAQYITDRNAEGKPAKLTFICTHNSRRSHLSQIWAQTAAIYYGLPNVTTYSGGTEATACNIRTVRALRRAGFSIAESTGGTNPVYLAQISESKPPVKMYSKRFIDDPNPQSDFAALLTCDQADASCPLVKGTALRVPIHYVDPKISDGTPAETASYDERSRQIAREMFFLMSQVKISS
jgi:protein-tyrosine-phosphatase